jgi:hypothetical protein
MDRSTWRMSVCRGIQLLADFMAVSNWGIYFSRLTLRYQLGGMLVVKMLSEAKMKPMTISCLELRGDILAR